MSDASEQNKGMEAPLIVIDRELSEVIGSLILQGQHFAEEDLGRQSEAWQTAMLIVTRNYPSRTDQ